MPTDYHSRRILGSDMFEVWEGTDSDQRLGLPMPAIQKPVPAEALLIDLPAPETFTFGQVSVLQALQNRKSRRQYRPDPLTLSELAFLCWATQGVRKVEADGSRLWRIPPSAGARHPFETYLAVLRVEGLQPGLYRYLGIEHQLCLLRADPDIAEHIAHTCTGFARHSAVTFVWTAIPYRTEWRYCSVAPKFIAQDSGHVCQNLYLACEAIGCGTCAVSAYAQKALDDFLGVDGQTEFSVYSAPVGKALD